MQAAEQICFLNEERLHRHRPGPLFSESADIDLHRALIMDLGDSILLVGADQTIESVNHAASQLHQKKCHELIGMRCEKMITDDDRSAFSEAWNRLDELGMWSGELAVLRGADGSFPAQITIKTMAGNGCRAWVIMRDASESVRLRKRLEQEKANRREMYQTLRNLMKSFEKERRGLEGGILTKIEGLLLPALDKIEQEHCADMRNSYLNILRMELVGLTKGFKRELEAPLLKLTRTQMRVCRLIQKGYTGKEIAEAMNISFETVQVHRRNIRKKLGLTGRNVNLFAFLSSKPFLRSPATAR